MNFTEMYMDVLTKLYEATMEYCNHLEPEQKVKVLHDTAAVFCVANNKNTMAYQKENNNQKK